MTVAIHSIAEDQHVLHLNFQLPDSPRALTIKTPINLDGWAGPTYICPSVSTNWGLAEIDVHFVGFLKSGKMLPLTARFKIESFIYIGFYLQAS